MLTVFVIDDALEVRIALSRVLAAAGYDVRSFDSAEQFLEQQNVDTPGCLLLDLSLPGMSGLELQRTLARSGFPRPIIVLTGHPDLESRVRAIHSGEVAFLTKPVDVARLIAAVGQALRRDSEARRKRALHRTIERRLEALTPRERQIMERLILGRLNKPESRSLEACRD